MVGDAFASAFPFYAGDGAGHTIEHALVEGSVQLPVVGDDDHGVAGSESEKVQDVGDTDASSGQGGVETIDPWCCAMSLSNWTMN